MTAPRAVRSTPPHRRRVKPVSAVHAEILRRMEHLDTLRRVLLPADLERLRPVHSAQLRQLMELSRFCRGMYLQSAAPPVTPKMIYAAADAFAAAPHTPLTAALQAALAVMLDDGPEPIAREDP